MSVGSTEKHLDGPVEMDLQQNRRQGFTGTRLALSPRERSEARCLTVFNARTADPRFLLQTVAYSNARDGGYRGRASPTPGARHVFMHSRAETTVTGSESSG